MTLGGSQFGPSPGPWPLNVIIIAGDLRFFGGKGRTELLFGPSVNPHSNGITLFLRIVALVSSGRGGRRRELCLSFSAEKTEIPSHGDNGQIYSVQSFLIIYLNPKLAYALIFVKKNLRLLDQNVKNKCKANDAQYT